MKPKTVEPEPLLISRDEVARLLSVSIRTLSNLERDGVLTPLRLRSGLLRYRRTDLEAAIEKLAAS